jgi:hypothetical protein
MMEARLESRAARWYVGRAVISVMMVIVIIGASAMGAVRAQDAEDSESTPPVVPPEAEILDRTVNEAEGTVSTLLVIPVTDDTYIASNEPTTNFGASNWLRLGYSADPPNLGAVRTLLRFDISLIPENAQIESATCRIYQHSTTLSPDDPQGVEARHLADPWDEHFVTWNSHKPDWGDVIRTTYPPITVGWLEADATDLVREWYSGEHANYGITLLALEEPMERQRMFYAIEADNGLYPRLRVEYTTQIDTEPPNVDVQTLPRWSKSEFTVAWSGDDPGGSGINYYDVQYRIPGEAWTSWLNNTELTSAEWVGGSNGTVYEFRARGVDNAGNIEDWPDDRQAWTEVDAIPPAASVNTLPPITFSQSFEVAWAGSDNTGGSGVDVFDVQYREEGDPWDNWYVGTDQTSATFTGADNGETYQFRARAIDVAGNVQPWSAVPQAETLIDVEAPTAWIEPFATVITDTNNTDTFPVRWDGMTSDNTTLSSYDVRYRYADGAWQVWKQDTLLEQDTFTNLRSDDGRYCFEARATDSVGRTGPYGGQACILVDRKSPFIVPRAYMPIIFNQFAP